MTMGDGYCKHCDDDDNPQISRDFLAQVFRCVRTKDLWRFAEMITEDIRGNCDHCGAEISRMLLALILDERNKRWRRGCLE
jgi:hypothetical protein